MPQRSGHSKHGSLSVFVLIALHILIRSLERSQCPLNQLSFSSLMNEIMPLKECID